MTRSHLRLSSASLTLALVAAATTLRAQDDRVDTGAVAFLRTEGLEHSQVMDHLSWMCDVYGPRLTGSPNLRKAQQWAVDRFTSFGMENAHTEAWGPFGRGWVCDRASVEVVGDNGWPVLAYPKAWSSSLPGRVEADVVYVAELSAEDLEAMDLGGKVVFMEEPRAVSEPFDADSKRYDQGDLDAMAGNARPEERSRERRADAASRQNDFRTGFQRRRAMQRLVLSKRPLAVFDRAGKGDYGTVFVQGASAMPQEGEERGDVRKSGAEVLPQFTIAVEHYNRIVRLLKLGQPVRLALELQTRYFDDDPNDYNVVAEIPGGDRGDELVMLGAHFDSWHTGTGCTDNGCGSAVVMEAARLLAAYCKETGTRPARTIRAALWSGEEQGLLGSRAYVREHFGERAAVLPAAAKVSGYFNLDNGTGRIRGVYLQGNEGVRTVFAKWLQPFADLDATTLTANNTGGTDHLSFDGVGIPGFQFIQDPVSYGTRTHHSNMDVWDHGVASDLQQAAVIMASFVWHTAQRGDMLPRKPVEADDAGR